MARLGERLTRARVLVVGGGPSGSLTALLLARAGVSVDLIDRSHFPRPKPCGEFVNPGAIDLLDRHGLRDAAVLADDNRLSGWILLSDVGSRAIGGYGPDSDGVAISRETLDARLLAAARAEGVRVREGVSACAVTLDPLTVTVRENGGPPRTESPTLVVGADGLNSRVARAVSGVTRAPKHAKVSLSAHVRGVGPDRSRGYMYVTDGLTVGLAATGPDDRWNATVVVHSQRDGRTLARDPRAFLLDRLAHAPLAWSRTPQVEAGPWASGPFDRPVRRLAGDGFVLVGDAAGYYDPLTGQGIYRALRTAELAAPRIVEALRTPSRAGRALAAYARDVTRDRRPGRAVQHAVEHVMSSPRLRHWTVERLSRHATSLDALLRVTGDLDRVSTLAQPSVWWPLLRRKA